MQLEVFDITIGSWHETDLQDGEKRLDEDMEMVNVAQQEPAANKNKNCTVVKTKLHLLEQKYIKIVMEVLFTDDVTSLYKLVQVVPTIELSLYNSEDIGADGGNSGRFGHIF